MTARSVRAYGLIAGIALSEQNARTPGFLMDMFVYHRKYDDEQHGITRKDPAQQEQIFD